MKNVVVVSTKGGVGKSTIANEIAFSLDRTATCHNFYSLDPQGSGPRKTYQDPDAAVSVIDTPGYFAPELPRQLAAADVIVIPTLASIYDRAAFEPLLEMAVASARSDSKIITVVNRWTKLGSNTIYTDWLKEKFRKGSFFLEVIPNSEHVPRAGFEDLSALAYACGHYNDSLADRLLHCINAVRYSLGLSLEKKEDIRSAYRAEIRRRKETPDNNEEAPDTEEKG